LNRLFYGDNLEVLRRHIADGSVDLVYLDPPFKSDQSYNVLFAERDGTRAAAQLHAFEDTWQWNEESASTYQMLVENGGRVSSVAQAFWSFLGPSDMMAYLAMMAPRLVELRRVLKPNGSLYLHCDPTASHYLKMLLDAIFGPQNFRNEIIWRRSHAHSDARQGSKHFGRVTDTLLFYAKGPDSTWNVQYVPYDQEYIDRDYRRFDTDGRRYRIDNLQGPGGAAKGNPYYEVMGVKRYWRYSKDKMDELIRQGRVIQTRPGAVPQYKRYLDEMPGVPLQNLWADLPVLNNRSKETLGYPTQKPEALLERVVMASSNEGDTVLDPFCGCGTTVAVAHRLKQRWIGIDITQAAIVVIKQRFRDRFQVDLPCEVVGEPTSLPDATALAQSDPYQFQWWALGLVDARPTEQKKGADRGIDGRRYSVDPWGGTTDQVIFSVKAGHVTVAHVRDLRGVLERERATQGVLLSLEEPSRQMCAEAASAGSVDTAWGRMPRVQLVTVGDILARTAKLQLPPARQLGTTFKRAPRATEPLGEQPTLLEQHESPRLPRRAARMAKAANDRKTPAAPPAPQPAGDQPTLVDHESPRLSRRAARRMARAANSRKTPAAPKKQTA
jgi:DNA modification methylase